MNDDIIRELREIRSSLVALCFICAMGFIILFYLLKD